MRPQNRMKRSHLEKRERLKQWKKELSSWVKGKQRVIRVEDNIRAREVEGGCTMGRIPGETSLIIYGNTLFLHFIFH